MAAYATVEDLSVVFDGYDPSQEKRAEAVLAYVSAAISALCDVKNIDHEVLKMVTCQVAMRVLQSGTQAPIGVTQSSWTASPFGGSVSYANPTGDIYFTAFEKRLLGVDEGDAFYINHTLPFEDDSWWGEIFNVYT